MLNASYKFFVILFAVSASLYTIQGCSKSEAVKTVEPTKVEPKQESKETKIDVKEFLKEEPKKDMDSTTK